MGNTITITVEEYKLLLEKHAGANMFADFVDAGKHSTSREGCGRHLGFGIETAKED